MEKEYKISTCPLCSGKMWFWRKICTECETNAIKIILSGVRK